MEGVSSPSVDIGLSKRGDDTMTRDEKIIRNKVGVLELAKQLGSVSRTNWAALEKAKAEKEAHGEFDSACPGYCGAQDTFYVGTLKGVGRIYQQTFIDTYAKVGFANDRASAGTCAPTSPKSPPPPLGSTRHGRTVRKPPRTSSGVAPVTAPSVASPPPFSERLQDWTDHLLPTPDMPRVSDSVIIPAL